MNTYGPDELVRLELLQYEDPSGLHPVEAAWRRMARKLYQDLQEVTTTVNKFNKTRRDYDKCEISAFPFPQKM